MVMPVEVALRVVWIIVLTTFPGLALSGSIHAFSFTSPFMGFDETDSDSEYRRLGEVEKECSFAISEARELKTRKKAPSVLTNGDLNIWDGDWTQEEDSAPVMPFVSLNGRSLSRNDSGFQFPPKLVSFRIMNVGDFSNKTVRVKARLQLGIISRWNLPYPLPGMAPFFEIDSGQSLVSLKFEGIYTETEQRGGERVICMLGNGVLPGFDRWSCLNSPSSRYHHEVPYFNDDRLLLVLRYPSSLSLTRGAIRGKLKSLNEVHSPAYFDDVSISSWQSKYASYRFDSEGYVSRICAIHPCQNAARERDYSQLYKADKFCHHLELVEYTSFRVVPNWNCKGSKEYCSKLGPFEPVEEITRMNGSFKHVDLTMQSLRCKPKIRRDESTARVSAIFRVVLPSENPTSAGGRSGINGMTLAAEGMWSSLDGKLCMVGCLEHVKATTGGDGCNVRISIYLPVSFSIKQRILIKGTISSNDSEINDYYPLSFEQVIHFPHQWSGPKMGEFQTFYKYSKISDAHVFRNKIQPFSFTDTIKNALFKYTSKVGRCFSMYPLMEDLTLHIGAAPVPLPDSRRQRVNVQLHVLSMDYWYRSDSSVGLFSPKLLHEAKDKVHKSELTEHEHRLVNVSADLTLSGTSYRNVSSLLLEGLYDTVGRTMYMIGCRDVRELSFVSVIEDIEDGFDCLIEVRVEYVPPRFCWFLSPWAMISITSQRNENDSLYFPKMKLHTFPFSYRQLSYQHVPALNAIKYIVTVLTIFISVAFFVSLMFSFRFRVPLLSLVMLGIQAVGQLILLSYFAEDILSWMQSQAYESRNQRVHDYVVKILVCAKLLVTLGIYQKAWKLVHRLVTRQKSLKSDDVLSDMQVVQHGCRVTILLYGYTNLEYVDFAGAFHKDIVLRRRIRSYEGLLMEFYFFPRSFRYLFSLIYERPMSKLGYIGFIVVRILPFVYAYVADPIRNQHIYERSEEFVHPTLNLNPDVVFVVERVVAVILIIFLIVIKRLWSYFKLCEKLKAGLNMFFLLGSRVYGRFASWSFNAEVVSRPDEAVLDEKSQD